MKNCVSWCAELSLPPCSAAFLCGDTAHTPPPAGVMTAPCLVCLCAPPPNPGPRGGRRDRWSSGPQGLGHAWPTSRDPQTPIPLSPPVCCDSGTQREASRPASADSGDCLLISPGSLRLLQTSLVDSVGRRKGWGGGGVARGKVLQEPAPFLPSPVSLALVFLLIPTPLTVFPYYTCLLLSISLFVVSFISSRCTLNLFSFSSFSSLSLPPRPHP